MVLMQEKLLSKNLRHTFSLRKRYFLLLSCLPHHNLNRISNFDKRCQTCAKKEQKQCDKIIFQIFGHMYALCSNKFWPNCIKLLPRHVEHFSKCWKIHQHCQRLWKFRQIWWHWTGALLGNQILKGRLMIEGQ